MEKPENQQTKVLEWRQSAQVNYRVVDEVESAALELMSRGASFADICEVIRGRAEGLDQVALIGRSLDTMAKRWSYRKELRPLQARTRPPEAIEPCMKGEPSTRRLRQTIESFRPKDFGAHAKSRGISLSGRM